MRVLLVDDEELALLFLEKMLNKIEGIEIAGKYTNADLAFEDMASLQIDLIFLDMKIGNVHGLNLAQKIISTYRDIEIVFVTAYPQFAVGAFEVNAIDYILKPIQKDRLQVAINKVAEKLELYKHRKQALNQEKSKLTVHKLHSFKLFDFERNIIKWRTRKVKELFTFLCWKKSRIIQLNRRRTAVALTYPLRILLVLLIYWNTNLTFLQQLAQK